MTAAGKKKVVFFFFGGGLDYVFGVCCQVFCAFLSQYCYESGAPKGNFCTVLNLTGMS